MNRQSIRFGWESWFSLLILLLAVSNVSLADDAATDGKARYWEDQSGNFKILATLKKIGMDGYDPDMLMAKIVASQRRRSFIAKVPGKKPDWDYVAFQGDAERYVRRDGVDATAHIVRAIGFRDAVVGCDQPFFVCLEQLVFERAHPVLLAGLHQVEDLRRLAFADERPNGIGADQDFSGCHAATPDLGH